MHIKFNFFRPGHTLSFLILIPGSAMRNESMRECESHINPLVSKNRLSREFSQKLSDNKGSSVDRTQSEDTDPLALIEDPLWRHIYCDTLRTIGPVAKQIWQVQLGPLSPIDRTIDLYCHTLEIAQILQQYNFIILDSLRQYFPSLKKIRVEIN